MTVDLSSISISALALVGGAVIASFYLGSLAGKVRLPALIGYMLAGLLLGPSLLDIFTQSFVKQLSFLTEAGLGFVAFSIGSELNIASLKRLGFGLIFIIVCESFVSFFFVGLAIYLYTGDPALSIILGAMAPASAPAGTVAVIQELKAEGDLTKALYAVVGFDDGLAVIIFGFAAALAKSFLLAESGSGNAFLLSDLGPPIFEIFSSVLLGGLVGFFFCQMISRLQNPREILIIIFGTVLVSCGIASYFHLSFILTNMVSGFFLANYRGSHLVQRARNPLMEIMPLNFVLFFFLAGAHMNIAFLPLTGLIGLVYIAARSLGKITGAWLGAVAGKIDNKIRKFLGLGILSQAGVAIGLALVVKQDFGQIASQHNLPHAAVIGTIVLTSITATSFFFEIIGPICTRFALIKAGEAFSEKTDV